MYYLKKFKDYPKLSEETIAFTAELYKGNKRIATCKNDGHGGCNDVDFFEKDEEESMEQYVKSLPDVQFEGVSFPYSSDFLITELVDKCIELKEDTKIIKKMAKKGFPYVLKRTKNCKTEYIGLANDLKLEMYINDGYIKIQL